MYDMIKTVLIQYTAKIPDVQHTLQLLTKNLDNYLRFEQKVKGQSSSIHLVLILAEFIRKTKRPHHLSANWMRYTVTGVVLLATLRYIYGQRFNIMETFVNLRIWAENFWKLQIQEPLWNMYTTIRYERSNLNVIDPQYFTREFYYLSSSRSVQASAESLQRMVTDFLEETREILTEEELQKIKAETLQGDIQSVMYNLLTSCFSIF